MLQTRCGLQHIRMHAAGDTHTAARRYVATTGATLAAVHVATHSTATSFPLPCGVCMPPIPRAPTMALWPTGLPACMCRVMRIPGWIGAHPRVLDAGGGAAARLIPGTAQRIGPGVEMSTTHDIDLMYLCAQQSFWLVDQISWVPCFPVQQVERWKATQSNSRYLSICRVAKQWGPPLRSSSCAAHGAGRRRSRCLTCRGLDRGRPLSRCGDAPTSMEPLCIHTACKECSRLRPRGAQGPQLARCCINAPSPRPRPARGHAARRQAYRF